MSNICCVAFQSIAHLDFGGFGYLNTALALREKGHNVFWLIGKFIKKDTLSFDKVYTTLTNNNFVVYYFDDIFLSSNCSDGNYPTKNIKYISQFLVENNTDCVLIDRVCSVVSFAALYSNIKWVGIGTCGRNWQFSESNFHDTTVLSPTVSDNVALNKMDIIKQIDQFELVELFQLGYWVASPYLNIAYLPYKFFNGSAGEHCLFVPTIIEKTENKYVLITFGNSMPESQQYEIIDIVFDCMEKFHHEDFLLLTGSNESVFKYALNKLSIFQNISIKKWMDYHLAFKGAKLSIGHGGTAHVWYSIAYKIPIIALPSIADQVYNSIRIMRLGIGVGLYSYGGKRQYLPELFNSLKHLSKKSLSYYISKYLRISHNKYDDLVSAYDTTLENAVIKIEKIIE